MSSFSLTGQDTVQVAGRLLQNFGDGDVLKATYPNDLVAVKTGKDGNSIFAINATGIQVDVELRVLRGSPDDKFLNGLLALMLQDLPSFPLIAAYFVKRIGDGSGNVLRDIYYLSGGVISKKPGAESNVEGATGQAITLYNFKFANSDRSLS